MYIIKFIYFQALETQNEKKCLQLTTWPTIVKQNATFRVEFLTATSQFQDRKNKTKQTKRKGLRIQRF